MTDPKYLFAFYLGGSHPQSNIELHNLQFAIGEKIEDCFVQIKKDWFGDLDGLHIDSYIKLDFANGYQIEVLESPEKSENTDLNLFCVHLGAKVEGIFEEVHKTEFVVAKTANQALIKVVRTKDPTWDDVHRDLLYDVETVINLSQKYSLKITKVDDEKTYKVVNLYKKI